MDHSMTGRLVGAIPNLPAAAGVVPSLPVSLLMTPSLEPVVMLVASAVVGRIPGTVMAPSPEG
jgi:hypothetical protein